jgi:hypothetical protein
MVAQWWILNWRGIERKWQWLNLGSVPQFAWRNSWRTLVRIAGAPTDTQVEHFHRQTNLLGLSFNSYSFSSCSFTVGACSFVITSLVRQITPEDEPSTCAAQWVVEFATDFRLSSAVLIQRLTTDYCGCRRREGVKPGLCLTSSVFWNKYRSLNSTMKCTANINNKNLKYFHLCLNIEAHNSRTIYKNIEEYLLLGYDAV